MREIKINPSEGYPDITLNKEKGIFEISGISMPINGKQFYQPVFDFLDEYMEQPNTTTHFIFNLRYFNISSSKMILFILFKLQELEEKSLQLFVTWCYANEDILEAGKDYELMSKINFQFKKVPYQRIMK